MNIFPQRETLTDLENKLCLSKRKGGGNGKIKIRVTIRVQIPIKYIYQKTDHIAREVYGTLCNNLHGKWICT